MTLKDLNEEEDEESLNKYTDEMELNEKHLSLIYDTLSDAIYLLAVEPDDCFRFISVNQAFLTVTGLTREQVVGKRIEQVLPETTHALVISKYKEAITENKTVFWEEISAYPTGELVGAVTVTPVWNADGVCTHLVGTVHDLSRHKKAEDSLRESEQRLMEAQKIARIGRWDLDLISNRLQWSDSIFELFEFDPRKFKASYEAFLDAIHPADRDKVDLAYAESLKTKLPYEISHRLLMKDGRVKWVHEICRTEYDSQGQALRSVGIVQDITERKKMEEALRIANENTKTIFEKAPVGIVVIGRDRKIKRVNDTALKMAGMENADIMLGKNCGEYLCPAQQKECPILDKGQQVDNSERIFRRKNGKEIPIIKTVTEINIDGEDVLLETFIDNTERKQVEEALRESEEKFRELVSNIPQKIFTKDINQIYISCNENFARDLGITQDELTGKNDYDFFPKELADKYTDDDKRVMKKGETENIEERYVQDGQDVWVNTIKTPLKDELGNITGILGIFWDITERKAAEKELKKTTELLQSVMDNATDEAIITTDQMGIILIWNEGAKRLLGYEPEEVVGRESIRIFHTEEYLKSGIMDVNVKNMIATGKPLTEEVDYVTKDGKTIPVQEIVSPRFDDDGNFKGMIGMARDITERKQAENERKKLHYDLNERYKELNLIYEVTKLGAKTNITMEEVLQQIIILIPLAWQYPKITCARITLNEQEYSTINFTETGWKQSAPIRISGENAGLLEVYYLKEMPQIDEGPFLKEERNLIDTMAKHLGTIIEHKQTEEDIKKLNEELEQRVKDRTAELEKRNADLEIMNTGFVGRELRMIELKKQIAKLEKNAELYKKAGDETT